MCAITVHSKICFAALFPSNSHSPSPYHSPSLPPYNSPSHSTFPYYSHSLSPYNSPSHSPSASLILTLPLPLPSPPYHSHFSHSPPTPTLTLLTPLTPILSPSLPLAFISHTPIDHLSTYPFFSNLIIKSSLITFYKC